MDRYEDYDSERLPDGSRMLTHRLGVREVLIERALNIPDGELTSGVVWGRVFDPGPDGAEHIDSPVRRCQAQMRQRFWQFDRRPLKGLPADHAEKAYEPDGELYPESLTMGDSS